MKTFRLQIKSQEDIKSSLEQISNRLNINGFIIGVVGDLSKAVFQCPKNKEVTSLSGTLEIITLSGTLTSGKVHLHLSISDSDCKVWGGHLETGTIVLKGADVLIGIINENEKHSLEDSGYNKLNESSLLEIATLPNCPWSARIKRILTSHNIPHTIIIVENDFTYETIRSKSNSTLFPQVFLDKKYLGGYQEFIKLFSEGKFN